MLPDHFVSTSIAKRSFQWIFRIAFPAMDAQLPTWHCHKEPMRGADQFQITDDKRIVYRN
jgi:hypothetical protein